MLKEVPVKIKKPFITRNAIKNNYKNTAKTKNIVTGVIEVCSRLLLAARAIASKKTRVDPIEIERASVSAIRFMS